MLIATRMELCCCKQMLIVCDVVWGEAGVLVVWHRGGGVVVLWLTDNTTALRFLFGGFSETAIQLNRLASFQLSQNVFKHLLDI